jgi:hypothetical protein
MASETPIRLEGVFWQIETPERQMPGHLELEYAIDWFPWILKGVYSPSPIHLNRTCAPISAL